MPTPFFGTGAPAPDRDNGVHRPHPAAVGRSWPSTGDREPHRPASGGDNHGPDYAV